MFITFFILNIFIHNTNYRFFGDIFVSVKSLTDVVVIVSIDQYRLSVITVISILQILKQIQTL